MTSDGGAPQTAFVWIWLPGAEEPVVAGRLDQRADQLIFGYGRSYQARSDAISIYEPELPLRPGVIEPPDGFEVANCILDAGPDSWGRRVIINKLLGPGQADAGALSELTYLLSSGSNRIGALDFQGSPTEYRPRGEETASLEDLARASDLIQAGEPVPEQLEAALAAGSSVGGARPKVLLRDDDRQMIAKFEALTDSYPIVRGEFLAMRMASLCGLRVAPVRLTSAGGGKDVLLVERFDRIRGTRRRRAMVSALTLLGIPEMAPREASYARLAQIIRERFRDPQETLRELFARITFNILSGNTDDHARNHAAFWDGDGLTLTPAYDICTYVRGGGEATQSMMIGLPEDPFRFSQIAGCIERAGLYGLSAVEAREIVDGQLTAIEEHWDAVCDEAGLPQQTRAMFRRMFPHRYALEGFTRSEVQSGGR
ncbi:MAG: type toxin-antitoxin system HipA family toxin [Solirubrobacterales bacterium]|jgi:serine/threonine-protein kinase HipA|nr:type toxin-antitoxin system HipA family toxin [Solirubrobacterales bacterium]